jgi:hypothetical protein
MPIIKSSEAGEQITVVVFTKHEIDALVNILESVIIPDSCDDDIESLDEFIYGLGIRLAQ